MVSKRSSTQPRTLVSGLIFGESPRWHEGGLWVADWGAQEIITIDAGGKSTAFLKPQLGSFQPISFDWLPDSRMVIVSSKARMLLRRELDGTLVTHADLTTVCERGLNEIVVDGRGHAYVNGSGFDLVAGEPFAPGIVAVATADGSVRRVADGLAFPNGMAVTPDNSTLIVAESYGRKLTAFDIAPDGSLSNRRVWADLHDGVPDGICLDAEGAVWYADVPNKRCVRVRERGEVLQTIQLDRGCFACMLGGADGKQLCIVTREWRGVETTADRSRVGEIVAITAPEPHTGWP